MTLRQLRIFVAVANRLNLTQAADELRVPQPAISHQLRLLQDELGQGLYRKVGTGIALTAAGATLLREAKRILARVEGLKTKLGIAAEGTAKASLCVGGTYNLSAVLLPSVLARFRHGHPQVQIQLRTDNRNVIERLILNGEVDVAVLHDAPQHRLLASEPFRTEPLIAFVAPDHPLARKRELTADDLSGVGFVVRNPFGGSVTGREYVQKLRKQGFAIQVAMQCDSPEAVKVAVKRKMGVGILYEDVIADSLKQREFKAVTLPSDSPDGRSFIVYHGKRPLSACAVDFLNVLREYRDK